MNYNKYIEPGVYKVRSIANIRWEDSRLATLTGNDYTYFLEISSWMRSYDSKEWEKFNPGSEANKKRARRAKIESKVLNKQKLKTTTLKDLYLGGI